MNHFTEIKNIRNFFKQYHRYPHFFTDSDDEKNLNRTFFRLIKLYQENKIEDDKYENLKRFKSDVYYIIHNELNEHIDSIYKLIDNGKNLDSYEEYPKYLFDFINYYIKSKNDLSLKLIKKFESIPGWMWENERFDYMVDKLKQFCKYKNRLPQVFSIDKFEDKLAKFIDEIYYRYVYDLLTDEQFDKIKSISYISIYNYQLSGYNFTTRYIKEYKDNEFFNLFLDLYNHFCSKNELPFVNNPLYENVMKIRKMYFDMKLSKLEIKTMEEFPGWRWSYEFIMDNEYDPSKNGKPMFENDKYIESMLKNTSKTFIRKNYNFRGNVYNLKTNSVRKRTRDDRLSKKKALLRISILSKFENGLMNV